MEGISRGCLEMWDLLRGSWRCGRVGRSGERIVSGEYSMDSDSGRVYGLEGKRKEHTRYG